MLTQTVTIKLRRPHPAQAHIRKNMRRFNVLSCGRRFGKTDLFIGLMVDTALQGYPVGYFAPVYKYVDETWAALIYILSPIITKQNFTQKRIELSTGGVIEMWTMDDPDAGRSRKYKRVIVDEAGLQLNLIKIWGEAIRPTLMDYRGDAFIGGTPKGVNDLYKLYAQADGKDDWARFMYSTESNPFISPEEIEAYAVQSGGRQSAQFRQEILAEFVESGASYFGDISHAYTAPTDATYQQGHYYAAGIDWGQQNDHTVCIVIDCTTRQMVDMYRANREQWQTMRADIRAMLKRWNVAYTIPEQNSMGSSQIEELIRECYADGIRSGVEGFTMTASSKPPLMQTLRLALTEGVLKLLPNDTLRHEMNAAQAVQKNGVWTVDSPRDEHGHGDTVVALALAWRAAGFMGA